MRLKIREAFSSFWERNPALFFGLVLLFGTANALQPNWLFFLFLLIFTLSAPYKKWWVVALFCFFGGHFNTQWQHPKILLPSESVYGSGIFKIEQVKTHSSFFHRSLLYKGTLKDFQFNGELIQASLPCFIYLPLFSNRPEANTDYLIHGRLCQKQDYVFVFKPDKNRRWETIPTLINLAEWRFCAKQSIARYLKKEISNPAAQNFLIALTTGDIDERILGMEFSKVGLQHILAISGFHFALAAFFLNFLLRLFFPYRLSAIALILGLTFYYLFLGNAASIQRAYIAIVLVMLGQIWNWRISGLNALGAGLIFELSSSPLVVMQLSFQLTFLCTLAILLFYPLMHRGLSFFLRERNFKQVLSMGLLDQHGYLLSAFFRKSLALNFAVHLISLPVLLHLFHQFPLLSIAYNLFFPLCVCLSMLLLFCGLFFALWVPMLSRLFHALNDRWTSALLTLTSNPPAFLEFSIRTKSISFTTMGIFLATFFFVGVIFYEYERKAKNKGGI